MPGRRRSLTVVVACVAMGLVLAATSGAEAQARSRMSLGFGGMAGEGRAILRTPDDNTSGLHESSLLLGLRIFTSAVLQPRLLAELSLTAESYTRIELMVSEITLGVRGNFPITRTPHVFYLRASFGPALARMGSLAAGVSFGAALGYSMAGRSRAHRFVEIGYVLRFVPHVDAAYTDATFPGYGFHPEDDPGVFAAFLGVTAGVSFDLGRK